MNADIEYIINHPGVYAIFSSWDDTRYFLVESEANGTVHMLKPDGGRDGVLDRAGWKGQPRAYWMDNPANPQVFVRVGIQAKFQGTQE